MADRLADAYETRAWCEPVGDELGGTVEAGYRVQAINTARWLAEGRRIVGRKIGLTSEVVQQQLGVSQPDFGVLFADMLVGSGEVIDFHRVQQPRAEAEVALGLIRDLDGPDITPQDVLAATAWAAPAIEVVGSRIDRWRIGIADTIADNASSGLFVLGEKVFDVARLDLVGCVMIMVRDGVAVSSGTGANCLGNPLNAAAWLARKQVELGTPLRAGEIIMTGALGPMASCEPRDVFEATITGLGDVTARFGARHA